jgi:hypothetical protein
MGKQFENAKADIEEFRRQEEYHITKASEFCTKKRTLQREWYGIADGDLFGVSIFEKMFKAAKRWIK